MDEIQFRHEGKPHKEHHQVFGFNCQDCLTGTNGYLDFIFIKMIIRMKMMVIAMMMLMDKVMMIMR